MNRNKGSGLIILLGVALLFALAAFAYLLNGKFSSDAKQKELDHPETSNNEDRLSGWKTYNDTTYHYSFRYPPSFEVSNINGTVNIKNTDLTVDEGENPSSGLITISVYPGTLSEFMNGFNPANGNDTRALYKYQTYQVIGGKKAEVTYGGCCGGGGEYVFAENNNSLYIFALLGSMDPKGVRPNQREFDTMLTSFRFPKTKITLSTGKLSVFKDSTGFGYQINVPTGWKVIAWNEVVDYRDPLPAISPRELIRYLESPVCNDREVDTIYISHTLMPIPAKADSRENGRASDVSGYQSNVGTLENGEEVTISTYPDVPGKTDYHVNVPSTRGHYSISAKSRCSDDNFLKLFDQTVTSFKQIN